MRRRVAALKHRATTLAGSGSARQCIGISGTFAFLRPLHHDSHLPMLGLVTFFLITLPWLNPFSPGPLPAFVPFLFSWGCAALLLLTLAVAFIRGRTKNVTRAVALAWLVAAGLSALIGLLQYFGATGWASFWMNHPDAGVAYGNLRQRNQFASLMNIGLASLFWWVSKWQQASPTRSLPKTHHLWTALYLLAAALLGTGNAASSSRTGLIQLGMLAALTWGWQRHTAMTPRENASPRPVFAALLVALLAYATATLALPLLAGLDPFASGAWARLRSGDALCSSRLTLWRNVLHLIAQKPWLGWGWGELDYAHFITLYPGARFCDILDNAHNLPLHLAVELGLPMALLTCGAVTWLVWRARPWSEIDTTRQLAWSVLAVIALHSLLEYPLWYGPFQMAALLSVWLLCFSPQRQQIGKDHHLFKSLVIYGYVSIAVFILGLGAFAAWNYQLASQIYLPPMARMADYRDDTLKKISKVMLFQNQVRFATLTTTKLDAKNAKEVHDLALDMLHFSPEARVVESILESSKLLGRTEEVRFFTARYQAAFPDAYAKWSAAQLGPR